MSSEIKELSQNQKDLIKCLISSEVLRFGDFTLKTGRVTPYFLNFGFINSGEKISTLSKIYAKHIVENFKDFKTFITGSPVLFGPAYKGIPLSVGTASELAKLSGTDISFSFNRKEIKPHGEKSLLVGKELSSGDKVLIIEDVISAGATFKEILPILNSYPGVETIGAILSVDRQERGSHKGISALAEVEKEFSINISAIVTIEQIINYLSDDNETDFKLSNEQKDKIAKYNESWGI